MLKIQKTIQIWNLYKFYSLINSIISKMSFNPNDFASEYCTVDEVKEIKRAFDLFDRDLGGAIDPRGIKFIIQNLRSLLTH